MAKKFACFFVVLSVLFFSIAEAKEIRYHKADRRDPFHTLVGPHAYRGRGGIDKEDLVVEGIMVDEKKGSYAVIGGEIYKEGETVDGAQVIKIFSDRVIFNQQSEEVVIWLREEVLKKKSKPIE